ncbi:MAG TPA: hypothetical protein VJ882_01910 [Desulfuromonadales bacterium]|nr:hypothetical protein [Desulfuromonadales bacterium]
MGGVISVKSQILFHPFPRVLSIDQYAKGVFPARADRSPVDCFIERAEGKDPETGHVQRKIELQLRIVAGIEK